MKEESNGHLHFELVSPEKLLFSGEVDQVDVPGAEGDFGVLAGHAPMVATLRPGILTVYAGGEQRRSSCSAASPKSRPKGLTVLADVADAVEDFDRAVLATQIGEMEQQHREDRAGLRARQADRAARPLQAVDRHLTGTAMH